MSSPPNLVKNQVPTNNGLHTNTFNPDLFLKQVSTDIPTIDLTKGI